ncbi:hypothetical protein [Flavobacterium suncheonense]
MGKRATQEEVIENDTINQSEINDKEESLAQKNDSIKTEQHQKTKEN